MIQNPTPIHETVREHYAARARAADSCCGSSDCCESKNKLYSDGMLTALPEDIANFSLGCGDPITLAELRPAETVLDLGSGGGLDCFLAAQRVGQEGKVIGVDMTPEMLEHARASAGRLAIGNVEFREGYLEALPVEADTIDVVISNCVINLSPDKSQVFREIFRVLKPDGRIAVSDIVSNGPLSPDLLGTESWSACVAGALNVDDYTAGLAAAGFVDVKVQPKDGSGKPLSALPLGLPFSATVTARKPA